MAKIFDFSTGKVRLADSETSEQERDSEQPSDQNQLLTFPDTQRKKNSASIDRETYLLWLFSKDVDELLAKYILEFRLSSRELAAILSHRLGRLVSTTDDPEKLEEFCQAVLKRMALIDSNESLIQEAHDHTNSKINEKGDDRDFAQAVEPSQVPGVETENGDKGA